MAMTKAEEFLGSAKDIEAKYMVATTAIHCLGDISRELQKEREQGIASVDNFCAVSKEDEDNYYGSWLTGYGFFNVKFPKESTRDCNEKELKFVKNARFAIA